MLSFAAPPNFEAPSAADGDNVTVTVGNVNEAPAITSNGGGATASVNVAENSTAVTTVTATDPDAAATLSYGFVGGADQSLFTIDASTDALSFAAAPDFENPTDAGANNVYDVIVQASDSSLTDTQAIAVTVGDVNETPVNNVPGAQTVNEDIPLALSGVSVADPDGNLASTALSVSNGTLSVMLAGAASISAGANGSANLTLSGSQADINATLASLAYQGAPDFNGTDTLTLTSTDGAGATDTDTVAIAVNPVSDIVSPIELADIAAGTGGFVINGIDAADYSGRSVSSAGDVNGDGFDDLIVGARFADPGSPARTDAGESYVIFGGDFLNEIAAANIGTVGNDVLTGTAAAETLIGGGGNDTLDGAAGNDVLIGGEGDDVLVYDPADTLRVDGGLGDGTGAGTPAEDVLRLTGGSDIDLTAIENGLITGIETIDAETDTGANNLTMDVLDALALSDTSNNIFVLGNSGDALTLAGGMFTANGTQMVGGQIFDVFTDVGTDANIFVDQDVTVAF